MAAIKPELWINYSEIYDKVLHEYHGREYDYAEFKREENYHKKLQLEWNKIERKVFDAIAKVSGLPWQKSVIDAYVVKFAICNFSSPLTIIKNNNTKEMMETLIHELCHNILSQNWPDINGKKLRYVFPDADETFWEEILPIAIELEVLRKVFGNKKAAAKMRWYNQYQDYRAALTIVKRETPEKIIREFIKKN